MAEERTYARQKAVSHPLNPPRAAAFAQLSVFGDVYWTSSPSPPDIAVGNTRLMIRRCLCHPRAALCGSLFINGYVLVADWILQAVHVRRWFQPLLAQLNSVAWVASFPGHVVIAYTGIRATLSPPHRISTSAWCVAWAVNLVLWAVALRLLLAVLFPTRRRDEAATEPHGPHATGAADLRLRPSPTRRQFLANTARTAAACAMLAGGYSMFLEARWFEVTRRRQAIRGLPPELAGLRLVQLTDIHHGPSLSLGYVREIVAATNALKPDLVLLTGDYVHRSPAYIDPVVRELAELRASAGVVGVLGNHDWWESVTVSRASFAKAGIPLLDNDRLFVTPDRTLVSGGDAGLCVAGVGDLLEDEIDFRRALRDVPPQMPRLMLSHNPDVAEHPPLIAARPRIDLMIAGHTHGGQIRLPLLGTPIIPSRFGDKYASGLVAGPLFPVYISRGLGTTILPLRFRATPEIAVMELQPAQ